MIMRARLACGCIMPTHCWTSSFRFTLAQVRSTCPLSSFERSNRSRFGKAGDGVERIADIVTYSGDEFGLGFCAALRLTLGVGGLFTGCNRRVSFGRGIGSAFVQNER